MLRPGSAPKMEVEPCAPRAFLGVPRWKTLKIRQKTFVLALHFPLHCGRLRLPEEVSNITVCKFAFPVLPET